MFVQGLSSNLPGRSFKSLSHRGVYTTGTTLMGCGEKSQSWNSSLQVKVAAVLLFLTGGGPVHECCLYCSISSRGCAAPSMTSTHLVWQTQEDGPAQSSQWPPDPSELSCSTLTLRHCLRPGGFEGPAELVIEVLVQVLRQWVQQGSWEQNSPLGLTYLSILPWFCKENWPQRFWQHLSQQCWATRLSLEI